MNATQVKRIKKWLTALRSGKFQQGEGQLAFIGDYDDDGDPIEIEYCCLGVACRSVLRMPESSVKDWANYSLFSKVDKGTRNCDSKYGKFHKTFGLENPLLVARVQSRQNIDNTIDDYEHYLAHLNDDKNWSFNKIARQVENDTKWLLRKLGKDDLLTLLDDDE